VCARQVFDVGSALRARSSEVGRNNTKSWRDTEGSRRVRGGRWRGGSSKCACLEKWPCLWLTRANQREIRAGLVARVSRGG
jgi:hypothetical protein